MTIYEVRRDLWLPRTPGEVFPFFADARNLEAITPDFLRFHVVTPGAIEMRAGALIDYRLKVRGFPMRWRTRISVWEPPFRFVDEMLRGPYRLWHHEHTFEEQDGGTLCRDRVRYAVPGGPLVEEIVHRLLVQRDVEKIFDYRRDRLREIFPAPVRTTEDSTCGV